MTWLLLMELPAAGRLSRESAALATGRKCGILSLLP